MKLDVLDVKGKKAGSVELPAELFDVDPNIPLMHQVVVAQLAAARQGTHATKTRGMVSGGGKKPWRQKGTGRARHGSIRSPQWRGGGIVFGPQPRSYTQRTPKKMKAAALRCALSDRARNDRIHAVEGFVAGDKPSTKDARTFVQKIADDRQVLIVVTREAEVDVLSVRNLPQVHILHFDQLNTYDVLDADDVIFTKDALESFLEWKAGEIEALKARNAKKGVEEKPAAKKPAAKKAAATKPAAKEADAAADKADDAVAEEKPAAKKPAAKKPATKKAPATKPAAKKSAATKDDADKADKPAAKKAPAKKASATKAAKAQDKAEEKKAPAKKAPAAKAAKKEEDDK